jgi:hypothetical protein
MRIKSWRPQAMGLISDETIEAEKHLVSWTHMIAVPRLSAAPGAFPTFTTKQPPIMRLP